jgi:hypothetical protein
MTPRKLLALFAVGATLAATGAAAETSSPNACFARLRIGPVNAYRRAEPQAHGFEEQLAGAHVFVYAEPGLTAEWLHYSLEQRRASASDNECPMNVPGARLNVQSGGPGFWVTVSSDTGAGAREILQRAQRLEPH